MNDRLDGLATGDGIQTGAGGTLRWRRRGSAMAAEFASLAMNGARLLKVTAW